MIGRSKSGGDRDHQSRKGCNQCRDLRMGKLTLDEQGMKLNVAPLLGNTDFERGISSG